MSDEEKDYIAAPSPTEQMVASKPPRARVEDAVDPDEETAGEKLARKRDYLDGFLKKKPEGASETGAGGALQEAVIAALKEIYDPEIPVNIYDLGLIYGVEVSEDKDVIVTMTLTTPHCPVAESMPAVGPGQDDRRGAARTGNVIGFRPKCYFGRVGIDRYGYENSRTPCRRHTDARR